MMRASWFGCFGVSVLSALLGLALLVPALSIFGGLVMVALLVTEGPPPPKRDDRSVEEIFEQFVRYLDAHGDDPDAISVHNPAFMEALGEPAPRWWRLGRWVGRKQRIRRHS